MASSETCSRCGQEVRWGWRDGVEGYLHRETVDHVPIFGHIQTDEERAEIERQLHLTRTRIVEDKKKINGVMTVVGEHEETSTTAEMDILKDKDVDRRNRRLAILRGQDPDYVEPLPPVEVACHPVDPAEFAPRSGIKQVVNLFAKNDWELVRCTHARGPYIGADASVLSISDSHVVAGRGPERLDDGVPVAVGSWRDGGFDFAFAGFIRDGRLVAEKVDATAMKNHIKGIA